MSPNPGAVRVSIVIPAYNAAETLADTLLCVLGQSYSFWEAVIVDDGSTDDTALIAETFTREDERLRLVRQPNGGLSAARNRGIEEARNEWLLFLDADDVITRDGLERLVEGVFLDSNAGAIYGSWRYLSTDGVEILGESARTSGDLLPQIARGGQFPVHSYLVRKDLVISAGWFDTNLRALEDWDLWLRLARAGTHFRAVPDLVALYRIRSGSMSTDGGRMLEAAMTVIDRCSAPDPRIENSRNPKGLQAAFFDEQRHCWLLWTAGSAIANGHDPMSLLNLVPRAGRRLNVDPFSAANDFVRSAMISSGKPLNEWTGVWPEIEAQTARFATVMEERVDRPGFAKEMLAVARLSVPTLVANAGALARVSAAYHQGLARARRAYSKPLGRYAREAFRLGLLAPEIILRAAVPASRRPISRLCGEVPACAGSSEGQVCSNKPRLPILMYHRVAPAGSDSLAPFRVNPEHFEDQLTLLKDMGYRSASFDEWQDSKRMRRPLPGRSVIITFDDGYADFTDYALPLLQKYGFGATVFVVTGEVGGSNSWNSSRHGESIPLLGWDEIRALRTQGIEIGAHTASHPMLTSISVRRAFEEMRRSKRTLELGLGEDVNSIAYPFGLCSPLTFKLARACGYEYGLTCRPATATREDSALALPRIDIHGKDTLVDFALKLGIREEAEKLGLDLTGVRPAFAA